MRFLLVLGAMMIFTNLCIADQDQSSQPKDKPVSSDSNLQKLALQLRSSLNDHFLKARGDFSEKSKSEQATWTTDVLGRCSTDECRKYAYVSRILNLSLGRRIRVIKLNQADSIERIKYYRDELTKRTPLDINSCGESIDVQEKFDWNVNAAHSYGVSCKIKDTGVKSFICGDSMTGKFSVALPITDDGAIELAKFVAQSCPSGG